ncbi:K+-transporting ATPase ATPase C chain [Kineothrix alysoides]|uniref:Potassium-transporting ATPase KdpC subunit n=1 Tax=Kineothrix alysoides TaxID=1469948 RepID=A0A4R1R2A0_9FIRM|nr:K(+)-transporting ATPase subunit C [Kineothrix alysoides]TCL59500.1 K+-transporting ATPase ATPase C chain [Kineothrix alysoides]
MKNNNLLKSAIICFGIMTFLCGIIYTAAITGISQLFFSKQANGSAIIITLKDGTQKEYGSGLIAQDFKLPEYLIGRPAGTSNLSPSSQEQQTLIQERIDWWHSFDPDNTADIPMDLVTASGSGIDPNITPEAAEYQIERIAQTRNMTEDEIRHIIEDYTSKRFLGFIGEPAVNVLKVNLALDGLL